MSSLQIQYRDAERNARSNARTQRISRTEVAASRSEPASRRAAVYQPEIVEYVEDEEVTHVGLGLDSTLAPPPGRVASPRKSAASQVLLGLGLMAGGGVAAASFAVAVAAVGLASFASSTDAGFSAPSLSEVLAAGNLAEVAPQVLAAAAHASPPAERKLAQRVERAAPVAAAAAGAGAQDPEAVEMSLSELRSYLGEKERAAQGAAQAPAARPVGTASAPVARAAAPAAARAAAPARAVAPAAPLAGTVEDELFGPAAGGGAGGFAAPTELPDEEFAFDDAAPVARPGAADEVATLRSSGGRHVVMVEGEPPIDPVRVDLQTDGGTVFIDGERIGSTSMNLVVEAGRHEVTVRSEKGDVTFDLVAGDGDGWCFTTKGNVKQVRCR